MSTPSVATRRTNGAASRMKRRIPFWITIPSSAAEQHRAGIARPDGPPVLLDERQEAEERR